MRKILIAVPAYNGQVDTATVLSIDHAKEEGRRHGWEVRAFYAKGSADIADVRNQILGVVRQSQVDDVLMVDADISWGPGSFAHLMLHQVDFIAGLYRERSDARVHYPVEWPDQRRVECDAATGQPRLEALSVPAGFLRVTRAAIDKMCAGNDVRFVRDDAKCRGVCYPFLFDWTWIEQDGAWRRKSEDYTFCRRWREVGGTVWVDPSIKLNHTGQKAFEGDFMAFIESQAATAAAPKDAARAALALVGR